MTPFELRIHRSHDPYTGQFTYPDYLDLVCGHKVLARLPMFELKDALKDLEEYEKTQQ
jgi:hypothetical protein